MARRVSQRYGPNSDAVKASILPHVADISCSKLILLPPSSLLLRFAVSQHFFRRGAVSVGIIRGQFGLGCLNFEWECSIMACRDQRHSHRVHRLFGVVGWVGVCKGNEMRQWTSTNRSCDFSEELTGERRDGDTALD